MSEKIKAKQLFVKQLYENLMLGGFILCLGGFLLLSWLLPDKSFSEEENRVLQQMPRFSWQQVYEGKWTANWEKYVSDQFPGRNLWISGKSGLQRLWGQKDINGVYLGKNDYLLQKLDPPNEENLKANMAAISAFAANHPDYQIKMALIPTSTQVLKSYLPLYAQPVDEIQFIEEVEKSLPKEIGFLSLYPVLSGHQEEEIYYRTDHHWTTLGAYYGYEALGDLLGYTPYELADFDRETVSEDFYGTLYSKGNFSFVPPDKVELFLPRKDLLPSVTMTIVDDGAEYHSFYLREYLEQKDKYSVFLGGNHAYVKIKTQAGTGKKLHLIKDSYAHCLTPFLALHYDEIYLYDLRYFRYAFADYIKGGADEDVLILYNMASYLREGSIKDLQYK